MLYHLVPFWYGFQKILNIRFVGPMVWPVANTKTKKENTKNAPKNVNFQNFEKTKKSILDLIKMTYV